MSRVLSGQITVTTSGTAVAGPATDDAVAIAVKAHPSNAGTVWMGNDGANDVTVSNGFPYDPGEGVVIYGALANLEQWWFDAANNGEKFTWQILERR